MLELAGVGAGDHVIDLGSGDGRIVITAAKRFGASATGVEIDPELLARSREAATRAGVGDKVKFVDQDLFKADLGPATVVTLYLMPDVNLKLRASLLALKAGTRIVSHKWDMGDWAPDRTVTVHAQGTSPGTQRSSNIHLWVVPMDVDALWCGEGNATGTRMRLAQKNQRASGTLSNVRGVHYIEADIAGNLMRSTKGEGELFFVEKNDVLHLREATGPFALLKGASFTRSCCGNCY
jgi:hypothetical protein